MPRSGLPYERSRQSTSFHLATTLAYRVVHFAQNNLYPEELSCPDCGFYPIKPITGNCGHTRCLACINTNGNCQCGAPAPKERNINVMVEDLIKNMLRGHSNSRKCQISDQIRVDFDDGATSSSNSPDNCVLKILRSRAKNRPPLYFQFCEGKRFPVPIQMRHNWITELISSGRNREAIPHVAILAAQLSTISLSGAFYLKSTKLPQLITEMSANRDPRLLTLEFYRKIRDECAMGSIKESDMECIICFNTLRVPITTPCGHTFCRPCLRRILRTISSCALCRQPLEADFLTKTAETKFITAALVSTGRLDSFSNYYPDYIPVFNCIVSYPTILCDLLIFDNPNTGRIIKWILEHGSRKFGILNGDSDVPTTIGTMVEIKDCVQLENGGCICSTVGVSRFEVFDLRKVDGCNMAEVKDYMDQIPDNIVVIEQLKEHAARVLYNLVEWLNTLSLETSSAIYELFGRMPPMESDWWTDPHGPKWLWWIIAVLPITDIKIKQMMLSTNDLLDRLWKVNLILSKVVSGIGNGERKLITSEKKQELPLD